MFCISIGAKLSSILVPFPPREVLWVIRLFLGTLKGNFFPDISCGLSIVCPEPNVDGLFDGPTAVISWLLVLTQVLH